MNLQVADFHRCERVFPACLVRIVARAHALQVVLLCTLWSTVVQYLYFKPRMSELGMKAMATWLVLLRSTSSLLYSYTFQGTIL